MTMLVGLTGGVASGKSTFAGFLAELGVPVVDADQLSHQITDSDSEVLSAIAHAFGPEFIHDGRLDRKRMRDLVFLDKGARSTLEAIIHPVLSAKISEALDAMPGSYGILECALLVERPALTTRLSRIVVIDAPDTLQIERMSSYRGIAKKTAQGILDSQCSREDRLAHADFVVANTGSLEALEEEALKMHRILTDLAMQYAG